ncbi:MAG: RlmE family RNA methyltransferase [Bdellovibrionales bacterium]|nr:RlmE family RNA methyltransferase [Bdellovibrionales bacterium]
MAYNKRDHYYHKAKEDNFAARSIYKLEEIDQKFKIIKAGMKVLDLGAAPGSWSQYLSQKVGEKGRVLGVDLIRVELSLPNAIFIHADLRDLNLDKIFVENGFEPTFDGVFSDMAPKTTGIRITDQARSMELCVLALEVSDRFLRPGGNFVCKFFHSDDFQELKKMMEQRFGKVEVLRPKSTRKESKEIFLIGISKKSFKII